MVSNTLSKNIYIRTNEDHERDGQVDPDITASNLGLCRSPLAFADLPIGVQRKKYLYGARL
jgi:hypothetical protein